jgi:hypothetical protein
MRSRLLFAVATLLVVAGCSNNPAPPVDSVPSSSAPTTGSAAPGTSSLRSDPLFVADDLPLLPAGAPSAPRPLSVVKAAYEFAARHPEVIGYIPCFCGCERGGHKSNESCFVAGRRNKTVSSWDSHGVGCEICLDVATETMQMYNAGASVAEIRLLIEKRYAGLYPGHTPTPPAPKSRGSQE